jgi:hypothetical protein
MRRRRLARSFNVECIFEYRDEADDFPSSSSGERYNVVLLVFIEARAISLLVLLVYAANAAEKGCYSSLR